MRQLTFIGPPGTYYAYPASQVDFAQWSTLRVQSTGSDGKYSVTVDDVAHGPHWYIFRSSAVPESWWSAHADHNFAEVDADNIASMLQDIQSRLISGRVLSESPVTSQGYLVGPIVIGDDYLSASGRAFDWFLDPQPYPIAQAQCLFGGSAVGKGKWQVAGTVTLTQLGGDDKWRLRFELNREDTALCLPGTYGYSMALVGPQPEHSTRRLGQVALVAAHTTPQT